MSKKHKNRSQQNNNSNEQQSEFLKINEFENTQQQSDNLTSEYANNESQYKEETMQNEDLIKLKIEYSNKEAKRIIENAQEDARRIQKQAELDAENLLEATTKEAKRVIRTAQENARRIQKQAEFDAEDLRDATAKEVKRIIRTAQEDALKIKKQAESEAETIKEVAYNKADEIEKNARNEANKILKNAYDESIVQEQKGSNDLENQQETLKNLEAELQKVKRTLQEQQKFQSNEQSKNVQQELQEQQQNLEIKKEVIELQKVSDVTANAEQLALLQKELETEQSKYKNLYDEHTKLLQECQLYREKCEEFEKIYKENCEKIEALKKKADKVDALEREKESLQEKINNYQESQSNEDDLENLEIIKKQIDSTNIFQENLLQKLENLKTVLENHTGDSCPELSKVDIETEEEKFKNDIADRQKRDKFFKLQDIVTHIKNYAGSKANLYYTDNDIRAFLAGMAVSRLIILQGMSGTGKSSLPRIFAEAISGFNRLIPVESSWRDRNELLGYFNDFSKKFNAKSFTIELYRSSKQVCQEIPTFITLDEMHLAHMEYYFSDFLSILELPDPKDWLIDLVSSDIGAKELEDGRKIRVTKNIWFVGTSNKDESTFEITDKVYDRAQVISLDERGNAETYKTPEQKYISVSDMSKFFENAIKNNSAKKDVEKKLNELDDCLKKKFYTSFGNRIVKQIIDFVAVFMVAGGKLEDALDYQISNKILRKVITSDDTKSLYELLSLIEEYPKTYQLIEKRISELEKFL